MRLRNAVLTIALAALPVVATATPAHAVSCNLVVDAIGDARYPLHSQLYSEHVDIVSADVASGPTNVTVRMRVVSLDPDLASVLGPEWAVGWTIGTTRYDATARRTGSLLDPGYVSDFKVNGGSAGPVPYSIDVVNDIVTWTIPRTLLPDLATPGATFTRFIAGTMVLSSTADIATNLAGTYVDQSPSCLPTS